MTVSEEVWETNVGMKVHSAAKSFGFGSCRGAWGIQNSMKMNVMKVLESNLKVKVFLKLKGDKLMGSTLGPLKTLHVVSTLECEKITSV